MGTLARATRLESTSPLLRQIKGMQKRKVVEYKALILGLQYPLEKGFNHTRVNGDSRPVCMQSVKHPMKKLLLFCLSFRIANETNHDAKSIYYVYRSDITIRRGVESKNGQQVKSMTINGRVLICGSNPHYIYRFSGTEFATELRIEAFSPSQRLVKLALSSAILDGLGLYRIACIAPLDGRVAPSGYYMVFAVNTGVPSAAKWVKLSNL
ncbi:aldehyde oxidase GLOX [Tanacetum coccineum]